MSDDMAMRRAARYMAHDFVRMLEEHGVDSVERPVLEDLVSGLREIIEPLPEDSTLRQLPSP